MTSVWRVRGQETGSIDPDNEVKSVSNETSFAHDLTSREDIEAQIATMAAKVGRRLRRKGLAGTTLALKVRYADLSVRSNQVQLDHPSDDEFLFREKLGPMLDVLWQPGMALRLVGVAVSGFHDGEAPAQLELDLFGSEPTRASDANSQSRDRRNLLEATDKVKERFGESALRFGRELRLYGSDTGSSSKNPADYK